MSARTTLVGSALVLVACADRPVSPPPADGEATPPAVALAPVVARPDDSTAVDELPLPFDTGPLDYAASSTGVLMVWSRSDAQTSKILAQHLDRRGVPLGGPQLVASTEGEIVDLVLDIAQGSAWLVHVAQLSTDPPNAVVTALALADDLSSVAAPLVIDRYTAEALVAWDSTRARVLALAPDAALVAALGAPVPCRDSVTGDRRPCPGYHLFDVRGGASEHVAQVGVDGGQTDMGSLVDVGAGSLLGVWGWHGGAVHADIYLPRGATAAAEPKFRRVPCRPPIRRGFDGRALVSLCEADYGESGEVCLHDGRPSEDSECDRFHAVDLAGRVLTPRKPANGPPITGKQVRCAAGHPVLDVTWKGGERRLDPQAPGADLDLRPELGVWTGEVSVSIGETGQISRSLCDADGRLSPVSDPDERFVELYDLAAEPTATVPPRQPG